MNFRTNFKFFFEEQNKNKNFLLLQIVARAFHRHLQREDKRKQFVQKMEKNVL